MQLAGAMMGPATVDYISSAIEGNWLVSPDALCVVDVCTTVY
jgi:hypothetical protein